jgi:hypothetical protein
MFQAKAVEEIKIHIFWSIIFFLNSVYEIMWKNTVEWGRPQMTIHNTYFSSNATMVARKSLNVTFYIQHLSC